MAHACFCSTPVFITVDSVIGTCPKGYTAAQGWTLSELVPEGWCPYLVHTAVGYIGCVRAGAGFGAMAGRGIEAQCPNPEVGIVVSVTPAEKGGAQVRIIGRRSACPDFQLDEGMEWVADGSGMCLEAYDVLLPYINQVAARRSQGAKAVGVVGCQGCEGNRVIFHLTTDRNGREKPCV